jgi:hypothetical protein
LHDCSYFYFVTLHDLISFFVVAFLNPRFEESFRGRSLMYCPDFGQR